MVKLKTGKVIKRVGYTEVKLHKKMNKNILQKGGVRNKSKQNRIKEEVDSLNDNLLVEYNFGLGDKKNMYSVSYVQKFMKYILLILKFIKTNNINYFKELLDLLREYIKQAIIKYKNRSDKYFNQELLDKIIKKFKSGEYEYFPFLIKESKEALLNNSSKEEMKENVDTMYIYYTAIIDYKNYMVDSPGYWDRVHHRRLF